MDEQVLWKVDYSIATYEGTVFVWASEDAERDHVIALARENLRRRSGPLPFGAETWRVDRAPEDTEDE